MNKRLLSIPQLFFIVATRAALGAGVALLASAKMSDHRRRMAGLTLAAVGAASTIPAARIVAMGRPTLLGRLFQKLG